MRYLQIVHAIPGRTRLRCPALRRDAPAVEAVADALAAVDGVHEVAVRPYTGSVLVTHDRAVGTRPLVDAAQRVLACEPVLAPGEHPPLDPDVPRLSRIAQLMACAFRQLDRDVLRVSRGSFDLGTLATLGFFTGGALEVFAERGLELPPWFNLAWWGYRTFMTNEQDEIQAGGAEPPCPEPR